MDGDHRNIPSHKSRSNDHMSRTNPKSTNQVNEPIDDGHSSYGGCRDSLFTLSFCSAGTDYLKGIAGDTTGTAIERTVPSPLVAYPVQMLETKDDNAQGQISTCFTQYNSLCRYISENRLSGEQSCAAAFAVGFLDR